MACLIGLVSTDLAWLSPLFRLTVGVDDFIGYIDFVGVVDAIVSIHFVEVVDFICFD